MERNVEKILKTGKENEEIKKDQEVKRFVLKKVDLSRKELVSLKFNEKKIKGFKWLRIFYN